MKRIRSLPSESGFTIVELVIATVIFPIIVIGIANAFEVVNRSYTLARHFNEMYAVLSACPEIDRALDFNSLSSSVNCFPNNTFEVEGGSGNTYTYTPDLTVTATEDLDSADPLSTVPDSKVIDIKVDFPQSTTAPPLKIKMLVTRNGIGQQ